MLLHSILFCIFLIFPPPAEPQRGAATGYSPYTRPCEMPRLKNGYIRLRQRGRFVTYSCKPSYNLAGNKHSACSNGKWDAPVPVCIKDGCPPLEEPEHSIVLPQHDNAALMLFCHSGYQRVGSVITYCDGKKWDRSLGTCREVSLEAETSCDFETEDLCGWTHDTTNEFVWKRSNGLYQGRLLVIGPSVDHTIKKPHEGYFMMLDMSDVMMGEKARLVSPSYSANLSANACFRIHYHMYGLSPGTLRVFAKPLGLDLEDALGNASYKIFEVSGNQRNQWNEKVFRVPESRDEFQLIIEGVATMIYGSHIAIDDLALLQGEDCKMPIENATDAGNSNIFGYQSCAGRCKEQTTSIVGSRFIIDPVNFTITIKCDCFEGCYDSDTCCSDYKSVCVDAEATTEEEDIEPEVFEQSTSPKTTPSTVTTTTPATSTTIKISTTPTTTPATTASRTPATSSSRATTRAKPLVVLTTSDTPPPAPNTTRKTTPTAPSSTWKTDIAINPEYKDEDSDMYGDGDEEPPSVSEKAANREVRVYVKVGESQRSSFIVTTVVITLVVFSLLLIFAGSVVVYRRKHCDPRNYKQNNPQFSEDASGEFSDVRFLTSDEQLDFTPQTPKLEAKSQENK